MNDEKILDGLNAHAPGFIGMLGGRVVALDRAAQSCTFEFDVSHDFCHSVDVIQGGFITAMLDAAMSHAVFAHIEGPIANVSSLEIKTSYLEPSRAGRLRAVGRVLKASYKTAFLEGQLYDADGLLTATSSSVAKLVRPKPAA
ncbi:MAG: thioesterase [Halioglobus sp.]|nr:thioesterase [Halioglobus sp.]|tara:strand:- start:5720 stop:6148 length:429 start_codon:yes stop_codon:yes gene_type:complete